MICGIIGPVDGGPTKDTQRVLAAGEGGHALRRALDLEIGRLARWDAFFARALRKQRDQRFQSAREMLRHLALIVGDVDPDATRSFLHALPPLPARELSAAPTDATVDVRPPGDATINEQTLV